MKEKVISHTCKCVSFLVLDLSKYLKNVGCYDWWDALSITQFTSSCFLQIRIEIGFLLFVLIFFFSLLSFCEVEDCWLLLVLFCF